MDTVRQIAVSLVITLAVTGILSILIPAKSMEKTMKLAIGLFFISSIVLPFTNGSFSLDFDVDWDSFDYQNEALEETMQDNVGELTERSLEGTISELLQANGIDAQKVAVSINITDTDSITITKIQIVLSEQDEIKQEKVKDLVREEIGVTPEVS